MKVKFDKASINDINALIQMRLEYLTEDCDSLTDEQLIKIESSLPDYYKKHLNEDLFIFVARDAITVSYCFLLVTEKPANPAFINGRTGTVLNVYTKPEYRKKGLAKSLLQQLIAEATEMRLDFIELKATDAGYSLYQSLEFHDVLTKYHNMIRVLP